MSVNRFRNASCWVLIVLICATLSAQTPQDVLGPPLPTQVPSVDDSPRPWVDVTGKHAVVATLLGSDADTATLQLASGEQRKVRLDRLSSGDAAYARLKFAPRVDPEAKVLLGTVVKISDGDTVQIRTIDDKTITVRLEGIDAPESGQPFGTRAKDLLGELVFGKDIRAEVKSTDRYGRALAYIYVNDRWVNAAMARAGMAWHYTQYSTDTALAEAEATAKAGELGLWAHKDRVPPWDWRGGKRPKERPQSEPVSPDELLVYVTSTGEKFHREGCRHLSKSSIAIPYSRAASRYSPCSQCNP